MTSTRAYTLTSIVTQGHPNSGNWVKQYKVNYGTFAGRGDDYYIRGEDGVIIVYRANRNSYTKVENTVPDGTNAKFVRIIAVTYQGHIAMRLEIKGCPLTG